LLTLADSIENARSAGINSFYQLCFDLIEKLKEGNHCSFVNDDYEEDQEAKFDCSSIALGNAFLAAKEICSGDNWELVENWTGSVDQYHQRMRKFDERLGGPRRISCQSNPYSNRRKHYSNAGEQFHSKCSLSGTLLVEIDNIYQSCKVGLRLEMVGNHVYRKAVSSNDESDKGRSCTAE
jgi:hypothetical protein